MLKMSLASIVIGGFSYSAVAQCGTYCLADTNQDGTVAPGDFTQWIAYYNSNNLLADINQDGMVTPADYTAWIAEYNKGPNGKCCPGPIYMLTPCEGGAPIFTKSDMSSCEGQYVEYATNAFAYVSLFDSEASLDDSLMQTVSIISCTDDCGDDPVVGDGEDDSSIVLLLGTRCEDLDGSGDCVVHVEQLAPSDVIAQIRLYRNGTGSGGAANPRWTGTSDGWTIHVLYDGTTSGLMMPYYQRWSVITAFGAWPDNSCADDCVFKLAIPRNTNDVPPGTTGNIGPTHPAYYMPRLESVGDCDVYNGMDVDGHYATIEWILLSDYDGLERARRWFIERVECF